MGQANEYAGGRLEMQGQIEAARKYPQLKATAEQQILTKLKTANEDIALRGAKMLVAPPAPGAKGAKEAYEANLQQMATRIKAILGDYDLSMHADEILRQIDVSNGAEPALKNLARELDAKYKAGAFGKQKDLEGKASLLAIAQVGFPPGTSATEEMRNLQAGLGKMVNTFAAELAAAPKEKRAAMAESQKRQIEAYVDTVNKAFMNSQSGFSDFDMRTDAPKLSRLLDDMREKALSLISKSSAYSPYGNNAPPVSQQAELAKLNQTLLAQGKSFLELSKAPPRPAAPVQQPLPRPTLQPFESPSFSGMGYSPTFSRGKYLGWGGGLGQ